MERKYSMGQKKSFEIWSCSKYGGSKLGEVNYESFVKEFSPCHGICSNYGGVRIRGSRIIESPLYK